MNGRGIETPANKIATAQAVLGLACRLNAEIVAGRISKEIFTRDVHIYTGSTGLVLPAFPEGTDEDLKLGAQNIVLIALSATALALDESLDEVFGKLSVDTDPKRTGMRIMVNQLRNAFAHNPWRPKWVLFKQYRRQYLIELDDGSQFNFDARSLDGDSVKPEQVGGLEFWIKLLQHCEKLVSLNVT